MVCVVRCDVPGMRVSAARLVGYITDYVFYAMLRAPPGRRYSDFWAYWCTLLYAYTAANVRENIYYDQILVQ